MPRRIPLSALLSILIALAASPASAQTASFDSTSGGAGSWHVTTEFTGGETWNVTITANSGANTPAGFASFALLEFRNSTNALLPAVAASVTSPAGSIAVAGVVSVFLTPSVLSAAGNHTLRGSIILQTGASAQVTRVRTLLAGSAIWDGSGGVTPPALNPEPGSLLLLAAALFPAGLLLLRRRDPKLPSLDA